MHILSNPYAPWAEFIINISNVAFGARIFFVSYKTAFWKACSSVRTLAFSVLTAMRTEARPQPPDCQVSSHSWLLDKLSQQPGCQLASDSGRVWALYCGFGKPLDTYSKLWGKQPGNLASCALSWPVSLQGRCLSTAIRAVKLLHAILKHSRRLKVLFTSSRICFQIFSVTGCTNKALKYVDTFCKTLLLE